MFVSVQKLLPAKLRNLGLKKEFDFNNLKKNWDQIIVAALGQGFENKSRPLFFEYNVLTVDCLNSVWANELRLKETLLLKILQKEFKEIKTEKIHFMA